MKKMNIIRLICLSCFMYMASGAVNAQSLQSILSGVANAVTNKVTNSSGVSLEGTWKYTGYEYSVRRKECYHLLTIQQEVRTSNLLYIKNYHPPLPKESYLYGHAVFCTLHNQEG